MKAVQRPEKTVDDAKFDKEPRDTTDRKSLSLTILHYSSLIQKLNANENDDGH